jgi:6-phosphofructokinase 1
MPRNALVAQSGGPSPVINSSLAGVLDACAASGEIGEIYAAWHGIEGVLQEELIDMRKQPPRELALLRKTPAAGAIGTCRYKLGDGQEADFERIIDVFQAHGVGYFFYIGGNDSMDTAAKVSDIARARGCDLVVAGVPKTIDNDVGDAAFRLVDHTPGYGSAARYWANAIQNVNEENRGMSVSECVCVLQAMGRETGFITAASRLGDPNREMPLLMFFAETGFGLDELADRVDSTLRREGRCIAVVSEGFSAGELAESKDGFGHVEYGASGNTAAQLVVNHLNRHGFPVRGQATGQTPGVLQRGVSSHASKVDLEEAYEVGRKAVDVALHEGTGWMATILRRPGAAYSAYFDKAALRSVANAARRLPSEWISPDGADVTDGFIRYAMPLIGDGWPDVETEGGLQRFARLDMRLIEKKCPDYRPCAF